MPQGFSALGGLAPMAVNGSLAAFALLVAGRRAAGGLHAPLGIVAMPVLALVLVGLAAVARRAGWLARPVLSWQTCLPTLWLLLAGVAVSLPGTSLAALTLFWLVVAASEIVYWSQPLLRPQYALSTQATPVPAAAPEPVEDDDPADEADASDPSYDASVVQHLVRRKAEGGQEAVSGFLRVSLLPGQRTAWAHLAFCPPFSAVPQVAVEPLDGPASRLKVAQVLPHGARVEIRLSAASQQAEQVTVAISAEGPVA